MEADRSQHVESRRGLLPANYLPSRASKRTALEDSIDSPFVELGLLNALSSDQMYTFGRGRHPTLPTEVVVMYAVLEYWQLVASHQNTLTFDRIAYHPQSPGRVFKLSESALAEHLDKAEALTGRAIGFDTTAGLRQLLRRKEIDGDQLLARLWDRRRKGAGHG